jgi:hypothetical protein
MDIKIPTFLDRKDCLSKVDREFENIVLNSNMSAEYLKEITSKYQHLYEMEYFREFAKIEYNLNNLEENILRINDKDLTAILNNLTNINDDWKQNTQKINKYGIKLDTLIIASQNIKGIKNNIFSKIQERIKEEEILIDEDFENNLINCFKQIKYFDLFKNFNNTKLLSSENFILFIKDIDKLNNKFYTKFWSYFDDLIYLSTNKPELLIKLIRLIEEEEDYSDNIRQSFGIKLAIREYRPSLKDELLNIVAFNANKAFTKEFENKNEIIEFLEASVKITEYLFEIFEKVKKCFPPEHGVFEMYKENYFETTANIFRKILNEENIKNNMFEFAKWLDDVEGVLQSMNLTLRETQLKTVSFYNF